MCEGLYTSRRDIAKKSIVWGAGVVFCFASAIGFLIEEEWLCVLMCLGTMILVSIPLLLERYFSIKMNTGFYIFCVAYALGPMLGKAYKLYYTTLWWDKLLHTAAGVVFSAFGAYIAVRLNGSNQVNPLLYAVFGFCFSVTIAAVWEFFEYGVDCLFAADMQHDTVIHGINSHYLAETVGGIFRIEDIQTVSVNGEPLEIGGYLDIGLIDTMHDMLVETVGAAGYAIYCLLNPGKRPAIYGAYLLDAGQ